MKKETLIQQLETAKSLSSQVDIDKMIKLINELELPKTQLFTQELADEIGQKISDRLNDGNSSDLINTDDATFSINYSNVIEIDDIEINCYEIMNYVTDAIDEFVNEEDEEVSASEFTPSED